MSTTGWPHAESPFHAGELLVQTKLGVRERIEQYSRRVVRDYMPDQHREFYAQLPFITAGHVDRDGWPWASILVGRPGFVDSPDARTLQVAARPVAGDPLATSLARGLAVGVLGMEPTTRRRNRLTARVAAASNDGFDLAVDQAFGNCPQYIHTRAVEFVREPGANYAAPATEHLTAIDDEARALIERADTLFVASATDATGPSGGADASHRGGAAGFVGVDDDGTLVIPDYSGNNHFNTLGNFVVNPRGGLLFVDFSRGDILMLSGHVDIVWDGPEVRAYRGAERLWKFRLVRGLRLRDRLPVRWHGGEASPHTALTGTWAESRATLAAGSDRDAWRAFVVARVADESDSIRSLYLRPDDGVDLATFEAGQHLPVQLHVDGDATPTVRTYTISSAPGDAFYRLTVKREPAGRASRHLHDRIREGDVIGARAPRGRFTFDASEQRPAVLLSAGVGVTPMIGMLRHAINEGIRTRYTRPITFVHAARTVASRAMFGEALQLEAAGNRAVRVVSVLSQPEDAAVLGRDYHARGHVTKQLLSGLLVRRPVCGPSENGEMHAVQGATREVDGASDRGATQECAADPRSLDGSKRIAALALADCDFYLCGPGGFMQSMYDALRDLGVADHRVFAEPFGPSTIARRQDRASGAPERTPAATEAVVAFAGSKFESDWTPADGTLLELAERNGLTPAASCRSGSCGSCATKLCSGSVAYDAEPSADIPDGHALLCVGRPAAQATPGRVVLDI